MCLNAVSPSIHWASICHLKSQSSNHSIAAVKDRSGEEGLCPVAGWIQKPFGSHAVAAVAAFKATVPRAISTIVDITGDNSAEQEISQGRDLQTCSFKTPEFIKILVTVYLTLQVLADLCMKEECFLFHAFSLQVLVM